MKKIKILIPIFLGIILMSSLFNINNVFGADADGNYLWLETITQNAIMTGSFTNVTYSEDMNITISNYLHDNFVFITDTIVNTTMIGDGGYVNSYQGIGIQIFNENLETIYAGGVSPSPLRLFDPEPFENIYWMSEIIELDLYKTINYVNITLWHNYLVTGDAEDYVLTESWKFNLLAENYDYSPPPDMFFDLYFLGFILCLFICPLSIAGTIKLRNPKLLKITAFSCVGLIICLFLIMNTVPFG